MLRAVRVHGGTCDRRGPDLCTHTPVRRGCAVPGPIPVQSPAACPQKRRAEDPPRILLFLNVSPAVDHMVISCSELVRAGIINFFGIPDKQYQ